MKNIFKSLMLVAVAAMTFTACQTDFEEVNVADKGFAITGVASFDDATRSGFDSYTAASGNKDAFYSSKWDGGESVKAYLSETIYWPIWAKEGAKMQIPSGGDGKTATFVVEFDLEGEYGKVPESGTVEAYAPAEAWADTNDGMVAVVPTFQTPREKSVDPAAHILLGTGKFENAKVDNVEFKFAHAVAYGKMTLKNVATAFAPVKAELEFYDKDGKLSVVTLDTKNVKANEYWFAVNPMQVAKFNVVVYDKDGNAYSKAVTVGSSSSLNFVKGQVSTFNVTMEKGDLPYVKYGESYEVYGGNDTMGGKPSFPLFIYNAGSSNKAYKLVLVCDEALYRVIPEGTYKYTNTAPANGLFIAGTIDLGDKFGVVPFSEGVTDAVVDVKHVVEKDTDGNVTFGGYKLNITVKDTEGNYAKYRFMDAIKPDDNNYCAYNLNNPPIPFNEATIEGKVAEPAGVRYSVAREATEHTKATGDQFELNFRIANNDTKDENKYELNFTLETSAVTKGLIPEGTYELGAKDNFITEDGYADFYAATGTQIALTKGSVKVEYTTDKKYKMTVNVTNEMKTTFKFTYVGTFEVDESSDFRNPDDLVRLDTPKVKAEVVNYTSIKLTWDAVADATKYVVTWDDGNKSKEVVDTTATIEGLEPLTEYDFEVVAKGDETKVKESREASVRVKTGIDPKADWGTLIEFTSGRYFVAESDTWSLFKFSNDDGDELTLSVNSAKLDENKLLTEGVYADGWDKDYDIQASSYNGANFNYFTSQSYPMYVEKSGSEYTVTIFASAMDNDYAPLKYKFVYTGTLQDEEAPGAGGIDLTGFTQATDPVCTYWSEYGTLTLNCSYLDSVTIQVYPFYSFDTYKEFVVGDASVEKLTLAGFNAESGTIKIEKQSDDTFLVAVDATFKTVGSHKFYFYHNFKTN